MKHPTWISAALLLGGCASAPPSSHSTSVATHPPRFEAGPGPYSVDCDASGGYYQAHNVHVPQGLFRVRGSVQFVGVQSDAKWAPMATIEVAGADEWTSVGIALYVNPYKPGEIQIGIRNLLRGKKEPAVFATLPFTNAAIPFDLSVDKPGSLVASVAAFKKTVSFPDSVLTRTRLVCSTGHVEFLDVVVDALNQ